MKIKHLSIVARDADGLADFYKTVFGCVDRRSGKVLSGEKISQGSGLPNSEIYSVWLNLPGVDVPFLEILEHKITLDRSIPSVNEPGYGHIAIEVEDIRATLAAVIEAGGAELGKIVDLGTADTEFLVVYVRDPEGNIVELEQC